MALPGRFRLVRCQRCGLMRQNPRLKWESLQHYYPEDYSAYEPIIQAEQSRWKRLDRRYGMRKRLRAIERFQPGGRLLDAGCGTGVFLAEAQRTGRWDLTGLDPSAGAASYVRQHLQIPMVEARFAEADLPPDSFDVITMWNVLEHLDYPIRDLRRARALLREDGWLIFSIPNVESLEARVFGSFWLGWDLPRHLYLFPRRQLRIILAELGFGAVEDQCIAGSHAAAGLSLDFWSQKWLPRDSALRQRLVKLYLSLPVRLGLSLPFWILDRFRACSLITVFARKVSLLPGK